MTYPKDLNEALQKNVFNSCTELPQCKKARVSEFLSCNVPVDEMNQPFGYDEHVIIPE